MDAGYVPINRKLFINFLWNEARIFSNAEAWIDLIQLARFEASTVMINGKAIEIQRGELPASRRFLELRWSWSNTRVSNFLKTLSDLSMISRRTNKGQTIIKLSNYGVYNNPQTGGKTQETPGKTPEEMPEQTAGNSSNSDVYSEAQTAGNAVETPGKTPTERQNRIIEERKELNNSLSAGAPARERKTEREKFIEILFFEKHLKDPYDELERFLNHYDALGWKNARGAPVVNKASLLRNWDTKDAGKHPARFMKLWRKVYEASARITGDGKPSPSLISGFSGVVESGEHVTIHATREICEMIENRIDIFKPLMLEIIGGKTLKYMLKDNTGNN